MLGRTIVLSGTHAFEWQVTIVGENSLTVIKFVNRVKATPVTSQDSSYVFTKSKSRVIMEEEKEILELEGDIKMDESSVFVPEVTYAPQYTCPNCGELFDGHECENCHYTENR